MYGQATEASNSEKRTSSISKQYKFFTFSFFVGNLQNGYRTQTGKHIA
jgi:hypothetical protein